MHNPGINAHSSILTKSKSVNVVAPADADEFVPRGTTGLDLESSDGVEVASCVSVTLGAVVVAVTSTRAPGTVVGIVVAVVTEVGVPIAMLVVPTVIAVAI